MSFPTLHDWNKGDSNRSRGHLQEPVDAIRQLQSAFAQPTGGIPNTNPVPVEIGLAKIVAKGPDNDDDFTDARYWIQRLTILFGDMGDAVDVAEDVTDQISYQSPPNIFVATNWPERQAGTHGLVTDGTTEVMYLAFWDAGSPQQKHYVFYCALDPTFVVVIDVPHAGAPPGGIYDGYCYKKFNGSIDPTNDTKCQIIVREEQDFGTNSNVQHWSKARGIGRFTGFYTGDTPPRMIIEATGFEVWTTDHNNPFAVNMPNAATQAWNRAAAYLPATTLVGDCPCKITVCVSVGGTNKYRDLQFDASGRLITISAEHT